MSEKAGDHWYRSADWDDESKTEFATKLARARPHNRIQYRRIKARALLETRDSVRQAAGRKMLEENLATPDLASFERTLSLATLARHDRAHGQLPDAMRSFRDALAIGGPDASGTTGEEEIELAEILLDTGGDAEITEAKRLLDRRASDQPRFPRSRYRLAVAQVRTSLLLADPSTAASWASAALNLAATDHSGLRDHPELGLVAAPEGQLAWLRGVAENPRPAD